MYFLLLNRLRYYIFLKDEYLCEFHFAAFKQPNSEIYSMPVCYTYLNIQYTLYMTFRFLSGFYVAEPT